MSMVPGPKGLVIEKILSNSVYMPDSRVVVGLRKALSKMSKSDLTNLDLVISFKKGDAVEQSRETDRLIAGNKR
jgi:hypothetical protein